MLNEQTFMIANGCNLSCTYCWYETGSAQYVTDSLGADVYGQWLARCVEGGHKVKQINITGGEPLLRADLRELLAVASTYADNVSLFTNGVLLEGSKLDAILEFDCEVHVSIDHVSSEIGDRVRGGTRATLLGIERLAEAGVRDAQLCMVVTSRNHGDVPAVLDLATKYGYGMEFIPVAVPAQHPLGLMTLKDDERRNLAQRLMGPPDSPQQSAYYARFRRYLQTGTVDPASRCRAAERGVFIDADGQINLCTQRTSAVLGNVRTSNPEDVIAAKEQEARLRRPGSCVSLDCLVLV